MNNFHRVCCDCGYDAHFARCYSCSDLVCDCTLMLYVEYVQYIGLKPSDADNRNGQVYVCVSCCPRGVQG